MAINLETIEQTTDNIRTIANMAASARKRYSDTKEFTSDETSSCMTIRVPVALLNRIRDLADELGIKTAD